MMAKKASGNRPDLSGISAVLDRRSYEWLGDEDPELWREIEAAVSAGARPTEIRRHVLYDTGRAAISDRCLQAARHVAREVLTW
jgi:hypothetical protein